MPYDAQAIRDKLKKTMGRNFNDPDKFVPSAYKGFDKFRFFVLPPVLEGDTIKTATGSGTAKKSMEQFYVMHAEHWINKRPYPCPRVYSEDKDGCELCQFGFDLMKDETDKKKRQLIAQQWLPTQSYSVNIYFPAIDPNPEPIRSRVMYYDGPKTCFDLWTAAMMREDAGDPTDPQAFGVFYDEMAAFLFQLELTQFGGNNSYRTSKFLANMGAKQIHKDVKSVLDRRIDLFSKIEAPNLDNLKRIFRQLTEGDDEPTHGESNGGGFDKDESLPSTGNVLDESTAPATKPVVVSNNKAATKPASTVLEEDPAAEVIDGGTGDDEVDRLLSQLDSED